MIEKIKTLLKEAQFSRTKVVEFDSEELNYWLGKIEAFRVVLNLISEEEEKNVNFNLE